MIKNETQNIRKTSYILIFLFMTLIIPLHLFPCFISGFISYEIIILLTPLFERLVGNKKARWVVVTFIAIFMLIIMIIGIISLVSFLTSDIQQNININDKTNRFFSEIKNYIINYFPSFLSKNTEELKKQILSLIESNLIIIRNTSRAFLHGLITIFIGLIIGAIISLNQKKNLTTYFTQQLIERLQYLSQAFRNIISAQIKISIINTILTSIIILIIFPIFKIKLPMSKTLILITFIFGVLPIIGNLLSNFMIIISALSISPGICGIMVLYLILIHKLEYFLNAKIIGSKINAKPWELLIAMLIFEAAFGLEGLIAAPVYYAYLKTELQANKLI